jgi:hypothetical protein
MTASRQPGSGWSVRLSSEAEELQALARMFVPRADRPVHVWRADEGYFLSAREFEAMSDPAEVYTRGELWIQRLNGLGLLKFQGWRPVAADRLHREGGAYIFPGTGVLYLPGESLKAYVHYNPNAPPATQVQYRELVASLPPLEEWAVVADRHTPDVDDALLLLTQAARTEDWRLLYVVYEIIEDSVGSRHTARLGERQSEIRRFKHTANSRRAIGTKARHGTSKTKAPANPMAFGEAVGLVRRLLLCWIRLLAESEHPGKTV